MLTKIGSLYCVGFCNCWRSSTAPLSPLYGNSSKCHSEYVSSSFKVWVRWFWLQSLLSRFNWLCQDLFLNSEFYDVFQTWQHKCGSAHNFCVFGCVWLIFMLCFDYNLELFSLFLLLETLHTGTQDLCLPCFGAVSARKDTWLLLVWKATLYFSGPVGREVDVTYVRLKVCSKEMLLLHNCIREWTSADPKGQQVINRKPVIFSLGGDGARGAPGTSMGGQVLVCPAYQS